MSERLYPLHASPLPSDSNGTLDTSIAEMNCECLRVECAELRVRLHHAEESLAVWAAACSNLRKQLADRRRT